MFHGNVCRRITRKYRRKQEVWEAANNLRLKKIADLRQQLEEEKAQFLKHKEETLRQIEQDAQRYDLDLAAFEKKLERQRVGKTYPRIYTWEEKQQMEKELAMKWWQELYVACLHIYTYRSSQKLCLTVSVQWSGSEVDVWNRACHAWSFSL